MKLFKQYPRTFWVANLIELFERWAWYGLFMVLGIYLVGSQAEGALGFTQSQKGMLMGIITAMVYFLPVFTGAIADRIGFKISLIFAFILYALGFFLMSMVKSYWLVFITFAIVGLGAAFFKPIISATISKTTNEKTATVGFGIFYMMVNIGAFLGPIFASKFRQSGWQNVFYLSTAIILLNLFIVIFFYKEPSRTKETQLPFSEEVKKIWNNIKTVFSDLNFMIFLLLIVGFWTMYNQFFYSLPIFIHQWSDTSSLYDFLEKISPWLAHHLGNPELRIIPAEIISDLDAFYIVLFQIFISSYVKRFKPINSILGGILIATIGLSLMFMFNNPFYFFITILIFSIGEMSSSPRITEYIGSIAPEDKKGLFMGMSFLPVAFGNIFAGFVSGKPFEIIADKYYLLKKDLLAAGVSMPEKIDKADLWNLGKQTLNMTDWQLTNYLWDKYHPYNIWIIFALIGLSTFVGLYFYNRKVLKNN